MDRIDAYLDALASKEPTPGGGSAATLVGAMGAALCAMVARITAAADKDPAVREEAEALAADADAIRGRFEVARPADEQAYGRVVAAGTLPRATAAEKATRSATMQRALVGAAEAPLAAAGLAAEGLVLAERAAALGNGHLVSDVECALHFFRAALAASVANVRINHRFIKDAEVVKAQDERLVAIVQAANDAFERTIAALP